MRDLVDRDDLDARTPRSSPNGAGIGCASVTSIGYSIPPAPSAFGGGTTSVSFGQGYGPNQRPSRSSVCCAAAKKR